MASFLCRPSARTPPASADLHYTFSGEDGGKEMEDSFEVRDHCNGLVLLQDVVANPATRRWARLPPRPPPMPPPLAGPDHGGYFYANEYLAFDPAVSPHYEVFSVPRVCRKHELGTLYILDQVPLYEVSPITYKELDPALEGLEWPPSPCALHVFSSRTGRWEERSFVREGPAAGTVVGMRIDRYVGHRYGVYWRGALYVQCQTDFIMRFSLSSGKYRIIRPPVAFKPYDGLDESYARRLSIGKSEKGVYSVLVYRNRIKVWILDDSNGQFKWVSKQLVSHLPKLQERSYYKLESNGPWVLQGINSRYYSDHGYIEEEQGQFEWDSDNDDVLPDNGDMTGYKYFVTFLGFHPYKEVIFLNDSFVRVLAYHLNSSKIQDLGYVFDKDEVHCLGNDLVYVERSFPYTPCWMTDFPQNDQ
ncbi:unnamed protein product [Urochloa decumbens]|uniref:F-box protein n=1 Tax=Urochloa decumbens TaxID=240449 RepID=A0ABC8Y1R8_9POAL